jgi:competence protein ComEC
VAGLALATGNLLFGRRWYLYVWLALAAVWLYAIISGAEPPVTRSAIMASVFLLAELLGRQRNAVTALVFAAAIMVDLDPQLIFSASFQMSFLAVLGLTFIFPLISGWGRSIIENRLKERQAMARAAVFISDSTAVTLAVWPVVAYYFGIFSLVGPLATLIALPALPGIIFLGSLTAAVGLVSLPAAGVIGWLAWLFLSYLLAVVNGFGSLPASHLEIGGSSAILIWVYYPLLAAAVWLISRRRRLAAAKEEAL